MALALHFGISMWFQNLTAFMDCFFSKLLNKVQDKIHFQLVDHSLKVIESNNKV